MFTATVYFDRNSTGGYNQRCFCVNMDNHIEDFRSLDSIDDEMATNNNGYDYQRNQQHGQCNSAFGENLSLCYKDFGHLFV